MFCRKCGTEIRLNAKFCHKCGTPAPTAKPAKETEAFHDAPGMKPDEIKPEGKTPEGVKSLYNRSDDLSSKDEKPGKKDIPGSTAPEKETASGTAEAAGKADAPDKEPELIIHMTPGGSGSSNGQFDKWFSDAGDLE